LSDAKKAITVRPLDDFLRAKLDAGEILLGYGRPLVGNDERVPLALGLGKKYGLSRGPFVKLALEIENWIKKEKGIVMNASGLYAAFLLDLGFSHHDMYSFGCTILTGGMLSMIWEQSRREPGTFLPMAVEDIEYVGRGPRSLKRRK
jgi:hypothetical protein